MDGSQSAHEILLWTCAERTERAERGPRARSLCFVYCLLSLYSFIYFSLFTTCFFLEDLELGWNFYTLDSSPSEAETIIF